MSLYFHTYKVLGIIVCPSLEMVVLVEYTKPNLSSQQHGKQLKCQSNQAQH